MRRMAVMLDVGPTRSARPRLSLNAGVRSLRDDGSLGVPRAMVVASASGRKGLR